MHPAQQQVSQFQIGSPLIHPDMRQSPCDIMLLSAVFQLSFQSVRITRLTPDIRGKMNSMAFLPVFLREFVKNQLLPASNGLLPGNPLLHQFSCTLEYHAACCSSIHSTDSGFEAVYQNTGNRMHRPIPQSTNLL